MEPAATIISQLGGAIKVAERLGIAASTVRRWRMPVAKGGTGGSIPRWRWPALIEMAAELGTRLDARDFISDVRRAS